MDAIKNIIQGVSENVAGVAEAAKAVLTNVEEQVRGPPNQQASKQYAWCRMECMLLCQHPV